MSNRKKNSWRVVWCHGPGAKGSFVTFINGAETEAGARERFAHHPKFQTYYYRNVPMILDIRPARDDDDRSKAYP